MKTETQLIKEGEAARKRKWVAKKAAAKQRLIEEHGWSEGSAQEQVDREMGKRMPKSWGRRRRINDRHRYR